MRNCKSFKTYKLTKKFGDFIANWFDLLSKSMKAKYSGFSVQMAAGKTTGDAHALRAVHADFLEKLRLRDSIFIKKPKKKANIGYMSQNSRVTKNLTLDWGIFGFFVEFYGLSDKGNQGEKWPPDHLLDWKVKSKKLVGVHFPRMEAKLLPSQWADHMSRKSSFSMSNGRGGSLWTKAASFGIWFYEDPIAASRSFVELHITWNEAEYCNRNSQWMVRTGKWKRLTRRRTSRKNVPCSWWTRFSLN